jgi:hypothetical protein
MRAKSRQLASVNRTHVDESMCTRIDRSMCVPVDTSINLYADKSPKACNAPQL